MHKFLGFLSNTKINNQDYDSLRNLTERDSIQEQTKEKEYIDEYLFLNPGGNEIVNDEYILVFNGQIYNYAELKDILISNNIDINTSTQEELLLALYQAMGRVFVKHLRGMFSIIIWDKQRRILFAARDHFGMKPIYYMETLKGIYFSFDPRNLYNIHQNKKGIKRISLQNYLTFQYVPEPDTMIEDIYALEPGSTMVIKLGKDNIPSIEKYWSVSLNPIKGNQDMKVNDIRKVLTQSVEQHMQTNLPIGCFLSGGIDSAIVTALAKEIKPDIKTFTAGFDVDGYSEITLAQEIADHYKVENISRVISPDEFVKELPNIIWHMGVPVADPAAIPLYFISQEAKKHIDIVLSGEGSDELFGGYNIYREPLSLKVFANMPDKLKNILLSLSEIIPEGVKGKSFISRGCTPIEKRYAGNAHIFKENEKRRYLKEYDDYYSFDLVTKPYYDRVQHYNDVEKMQYIDMHTWLTGDILVKTNRMTSAHSLELRCPFMDKRVFDIASILDLEDKIQGRTTKYLLRRAFSHMLPDSVTGRKKLGYPVPIRVWLKDELYDWAVNTVKSSNAEEYINKHEVIRLIDEHQKGRRDNSRKIWTMLTFLLWFEIYYDSNKEQLPFNSDQKASFEYNVATL